ncbi:MAG: ABC transporter ATP-binding protein [Anaerolineae bacterium]
MGIYLHNVTKAYETDAGDFLALKGIDLHVEPGQFAAVVGKSGSGKSTLMNMITGIDRPTSGEVIVAGTAVHPMTEGQVARWRGLHLGVVFQFFQLLPTLTVVENVMMPMDFCGQYTRPQRKARALDLLAQVDIVEHAYKMPAEISGGQEQRAAFARALANDPPIICADEPTGSLDTRTAVAIFRLFADLVGQGKTMLMVTHDEDLAQRAGRSITLADGLIAGEPEVAHGLA